MLRVNTLFWDRNTPACRLLYNAPRADKMKQKALIQTLIWVQTLCSLVGGGFFTVGMWLVSSASVRSRVPFTWVFGAILFTISTATILTSILIVTTNVKLRRLYIFVGVLCTLTCGWSIVIMFRHPLVAATLPCPVGTYGAPDLTTCLPCRCLHGTCSDGRNGDGSCDCDVRWRGRYCDRCGKNVYHNMANPDGPAVCDFCNPGWAMPACTTCYTGYNGTNCDKCSDNVQKYEFITVEDYAPPNEGWGKHPEWGLNPWGERRDKMVPIYHDELGNTDMLRCDGCKRGGNNPKGAVIRNTRFCTEANCNTMDPNAIVKENAMPDRMLLTDTDCFDDYDCPTWFCFKDQKQPSGKCTALSRESMGCNCSTFGATGALCLFCDSVSDVHPCGEGNCVWDVFEQPWLKSYEALDTTYGQVECMCKNGSEVGEHTWTRYPKDLTERRELDGTLNLKNASCTVRTDKRGCTDNTFGKHCLPCECSGHGLCAETVDGDGSCRCTLDNWFALEANGMWGGPLCDRCLEDCTLNNDTCIVQFESGYGGSISDSGRCHGAPAAMNRSIQWNKTWGYIYDLSPST